MDASLCNRTTKSMDFLQPLNIILAKVNLNGVKQSFIALNVEKLWFREKCTLSVVDFNNVMMFLLILNFLRRIKIFCGE